MTLSVESKVMVAIRQCNLRGEITHLKPLAESLGLSVKETSKALDALADIGIVRTDWQLVGERYVRALSIAEESTQLADNVAGYDT